MSERAIRNCNVCVVGGAGFLGSHLVNHLIDDRDCNVFVIDNLITGQLKYLHPKAFFNHADITGSEEYLNRIFKDAKIEYVFNYAAEPYIPVSFERPLHVFNTNAFGALKIINAAQEAGCKGILQVSSAEIYGDQKGSISETDQINPHSTYGASKSAIDFIVQARWKENQTPCIALRQFNCLGERETHPYIVPEIISQLYQEKYNSCNPERTGGVCTIHLGNNSRRDFLYAGDAVRMAVELLEKGNFGEVYNLGSQDTITMYDLARLIAEKMGLKVSIEADQSRARPWEIWHLQSNNSKVYGVIEARPRVTLDAAIRLTLDYFNNNGQKWDWE